MIFINPRNPKPLHEQIGESVMEQIMIGALSPGDKLPSIRELAQSMRIAPNTIQRAYRDLENAGIIISYPARGSFISINNDEVLERRRGELLADFIRLSGELKKLGVREDELIDKIKL
jgi:GntR family transcriptional regulator